MSILDISVRYTHTVVSATAGSKFADAISYGSGFMLSYKGYVFFITAAHVPEPTWSEKEFDPTILNNDFAIITNKVAEN